MKRRSKAGGKAVKARRRKAAMPKLHRSRKAAPRRRSTTSGQETEVARLTRERNEALKQLSAAFEVLRVISSSPGDLEAVFQAMLENAVRICEAKFGVMFRFEGDETYAVATLNLPTSIREFFRQRGRAKPTPGSDLDQLRLTKQVIQTIDMAASPNPSRISKLAFVRTQIAVPMLKDDEIVGSIMIYRQEVRPFTDKQIELVQNFAAQAVIAIENTRLLSELRESLQQQTASAEVLGVISSSTGQLEPVFNSMLEHATRICEAKFGAMYFREGDGFRTVAMHGAPRAYMEEGLHKLRRPGSNTGLGRVVRTKEVVQIEDITADQAYAERDPMRVAAAELGGVRTVLCVPLLKDNEVIGSIAIYREIVRPFADKQIALVRSFANQAVIAIENTRLLNELRQRTDDLTESLEQQTATSEVLRIIATSPQSVQPVFDAIVANAAHLCEATFSAVAQFDGELLHLVAVSKMSPEETAAYHTVFPRRPNRTFVMGRAFIDGKPVHVEDIETDPDYDPRTLSVLKAAAPYRTYLGIPIVRDGVPIGVIGCGRREVRPFTEAQIALVENFAAQAVIAIENARLLNELRQRTDDLSKSLDDLRTTQDRLVQTEKLAALGQLTAGIAHEIKNPLNFVNNFSGISTELIGELQNTLSGISVDPETHAELKDLTDTLHSNLEKIVQHGKRADAIVKSMLLHSGETSGELRSTDINALVDESLTRAYYNARAEERGFTIKLERSFDPSAGEANLFPREIARALLNLISNGFYAATKRNAEAKGGEHEATLVTTTKSLGDRVEIRIRDNGSGIPADVKEKMFDPFFTTKPTGEGTGLGLSISHDIIVKQHGGSIEVDTELGEFAEIRVILPRSPSG